MHRIQQLESLLLNSPNDSFLQHALALEHLKINNLQKARHYFENLLQQNPRYLGSYYHLAQLYQKINLPQNAIDTYKKGLALAKDLNNNHAYNELLLALQDLED